jgi:hypothetical protein
MASPEESWRDVLLAGLTARRPETDLHFAYYRGDHRLPRPPRAATDAYQRLLKQSRTNWCRLIVDSVAERLKVVGFRFGDEKAGDEQAWLFWQANRLDADSEMAHTDALVAGRTFVIVWPDEANASGVRVSIEHPTQCIVAYEPGDAHSRIAALKTYVDPLAGVRSAWLVSAQGTWTWQRPLAAGEEQGPGSTSTVSAAPATTWELIGEEPNPLGVVPVVELRPWPQTLGAPWSEFDGGVIDIQDRINSTIFNRMMATEYAAWRQKYVTGLTVPTVRDPFTGEEVRDANGQPIPVAPFDVAVDRLWVAEDPNVKFGEFSESDLTGYIRAVESDVQHLAAITHTPPHYLLGNIVNASGDALKAAETGLVKKVEHRAGHLGEAWEDVIRLCFQAIGDARAADVQAETVWADFETRSEGETVDALIKMATLGVPNEVLWQRWGASPQEVERWGQLSTTQALTAALAAPLPTAPAAA